MKTLTFVIPVFNEEKRLALTMQALRTLTMPKGYKLAEVIFVNDGSTDDTLMLLKRAKATVLRVFKNHFPKAKITILSYRNNQGKGFAITQGMHASSADYTLFFDADMSTPLSEIEKFVPFMNKGKDVIIGTRKNGKSTVIMHQPLIRETLGHVFTKMAQTVLDVSVTDFTCGFKAFSKKAKESIFTATTIHRWGYDGEIIYLSKKNKLKMIEKSVKWSNEPNTKVNLTRAIPQTIIDLIMIRWNHEGRFAFMQALETLKTLPLAERLVSRIV